MTFAAVAAATLSLLFRYPARRVPGERGATTAVLLLGLGVYLVSSDTPIGDWLYPITGTGYADTFVGNLCWIGGLVALLHHVLDRLADHPEQVQFFDALLRWPITFAVPMMLAAMYFSHPLALAPVPDIGDAHADIWLIAYRVLYYGTLVYLCALLLRTLPIVKRDDGRSCYVSVLYMLAAGTILFGLCTRVLSYIDTLWWLHLVSPITRCCSVITVAVAAAVSWFLKAREAAHPRCAEAAQGVQRAHWLGCQPDV